MQLTGRNNIMKKFYFNIFSMFILCCSSVFASAGNDVEDTKEVDASPLKELMLCYSRRMDYALYETWNDAKRMSKEDTTVENAFKVHLIVEQGGFLGLAMKVKDQCDTGFHKKYPEFSDVDKEVELLSEVYIKEMADLDAVLSRTCLSELNNDSLKRVATMACDSLEKAISKSGW